MSSVLPGKKIPAVAIASLVLGGSCTDIATTGAVARQMCRNFDRCPEYYYRHFDSLDECIAEVQPELEEDLARLADRAGDSCADAYLEYAACFALALADCEWSDAEDRGYDPDGHLYSATIITTTPNKVVAPVHNRMPAILSGPEAEAAWLNPELSAADAIAMLGPLDPARMAGAPANPKLNKVGNKRVWRFIR